MTKDMMETLRKNHANAILTYEQWVMQCLNNHMCVSDVKEMIKTHALVKVGEWIETCQERGCDMDEEFNIEDMDNLTIDTERDLYTYTVTHNLYKLANA